MMQRIWTPMLTAAVAICSTTSTMAADPSGTWKWNSDLNGNEIQNVLRLQADGEKLTGTYANQRMDAKLENGKFADDKATFHFTLERDGQKMLIHFTCKVTGDKMDGAVTFERNGEKSQEFEWVAKRTVDAQDVVGTWKLKIETDQGQVFEPTVSLKQDGDKLTGQYDSQIAGEFPVAEAKVKDNKLTLVIKGKVDGNAFTVTYVGKPQGKKISGTVSFDVNGNTGETKFQGERTAKKA